MAQFDRKRRAEIYDEVPPVKCSATAKRTGQRCEQFAMINGSVCKTHGGMARQVRARAEVGVTLKEAMKFGPRRSPAELLADAAHLADVLLRRSIEANGDQVEPLSYDVLERIVGDLGRVGHLAKINLDAGLDASTPASQYAGQVVFLLRTAGLALGLNLENQTVSRAVGRAARELEAAGPRIVDREQVMADISDRCRREHMAAEQAAEQLAREAEAKIKARIDEAVTAAVAAERARTAMAVRKAIEAPPAPHREAQSTPVPSEPSDPSPVLTGEIIAAAYRRCDGCGRPKTPGHDQECGWSAIANSRGAMGRFGG